MVVVTTVVVWGGRRGVGPGVPRQVLVPQGRGECGGEWGTQAPCAALPGGGQVQVGVLPRPGPSGAEVSSQQVHRLQQDDGSRSLQPGGS